MALTASAKQLAAMLETNDERLLSPFVANPRVPRQALLAFAERPESEPLRQQLLKHPSLAYDAVALDAQWSIPRRRRR